MMKKVIAIFAVLIVVFMMSECGEYLPEEFKNMTTLEKTVWCIGFCIGYIKGTLIKLFRI